MGLISGIVKDVNGSSVAGKPVRAYRRDTGVLLATTTTGDGSPGDASWPSVQLLLHMDGETGATSFPDQSSFLRSVVPGGAAKISADQSVFGGASAVFDGAPNTLLTLSSEIAFAGGEDFTIEGWIFPRTTTTYSHLCGNKSSNVQLCRIQSSNGALIAALSGEDVLSASNIPRNVWGHFALVRAGGVLSFFYNGNFVVSKSSTTAFSVNAVGGGYGLYGAQYIDELRITKGVARYSNNFTPQAAPFPKGTPLALGAYQLDTGTYSGVCNIVALDDSLPDLILRTTPV